MKKPKFILRAVLSMVALFLTLMPDVCMAASPSHTPILISVRKSRSRNPDRHRAPGDDILTIEKDGRDITVFFPDYAEYARVMVGQGNLVEFEEFTTPDNPTAHIPEIMTGIYTLTISLDDIDYYETDILLQ